jgi:hypothetical protein
MPAELYAAILLILRFVSVALIIDVINKQLILRRRPIKDRRAGVLRRDMYKLSLIALALNIVPIIVDVLTLLGMSNRPANVSLVSVFYVFSYSLGTLALTLIIYRMYRKSLDY